METKIINVYPLGKTPARASKARAISVDAAWSVWIHVVI